MPDHLKESERLNELYRLYGVAAHHCANIEYRMALLLLDPEWAKVEDFTTEEIQAVYERLFSDTLGALLGKLKQHFEVSEAGEKLWKDVKDKRNYLVHKFYGQYGKNMKHGETIEKMVEELKELISFFEAASLELEGEVEEYMNRKEVRP